MICRTTPIHVCKVCMYRYVQQPVERYRHYYRSQNRPSQAHLHVDLQSDIWYSPASRRQSSYHKPAIISSHYPPLPSSSPSPPAAAAAHPARRRRPFICRIEDAHKNQTETIATHTLSQDPPKNNKKTHFFLVRLLHAARALGVDERTSGPRAAVAAEEAPARARHVVGGLLLAAHAAAEEEEDRGQEERHGRAPREAEGVAAEVRRHRGLGEDVAGLDEGDAGTCQWLRCTRMRASAARTGVWGLGPPWSQRRRRRKGGDLRTS